MLLASKEETCGMITYTSLTLALTNLILFICTWNLGSLSVTHLHLVLTASVYLLSTTAVIKETNRLINGMAMLITTLPWVFYGFMLIMSLITNLVLN